MTHQDFAHLHVHTEYSMLDGAARVRPLAARAAELGMSALGMTDHGNMFGAYEHYQECTTAGVKPILGIEAYVAPGSRHHKQPIFWGDPTRRNVDGESDDVSGKGAYLHMTMLAETAEGLRNLFWLSSKASIEGFYRAPRMDKELLAERSSGIIVTTGCPGGEVSTRLALGQYQEAYEAAGELQDMFGKGNVFLELMEHGIPIERRLKDGLLEIGRKVGLPPLATNDLHYVNAEDHDLHDTLLCVNGAKKADAKRFKFTGDSYYLRSPAEMRELFDDQVPGACDNTLLIAERVESYGEVFAQRDLMPKFDVPEGESQESWLRKEVERGLVFRYGESQSTEVRERIEYELDVITRCGFAAYFLVVADILRYARENSIASGPGRGSTAGSLVAYVLRITEMDPLKFGLMFERFLNPERVTPPDADLDFADRDRGKLIEYLSTKYGTDYCSNVVTLNMLKAKAAIKDATRVLGFDYALGDKITKALPPSHQGNEAPLSAIFDETHIRHKETGAIRDLYNGNPDVKVIIDTAQGIEGIARGTGVHAAGVILSSEPLIDVVPMMRRPKDGIMLCGFQYPQAEAMGLLKIDFLGLRNLTIMQDAVAGIKKRLGIEIDLLTLPLDDAETYKLLAKGDTLGVFQLDSTGCRNLLRMMEPDSFEHISATLALYRPGPMGANAHTAYALRRTAKQPLTPIHPELEKVLEPILGPTYQLVVYQEQVMAIAQQLAGYTLAGADLLRKAMGKKKKEILDKEWDKFSAGMAERGFSEQAVKALWDVLIPFSDYAFNRAHAASYAMIAYWTAYLKAHYPADYMAATLSSVRDKKDRMAIYLAECRRIGIKVLPPDVNESAHDFTAVSNTEIRFGLGSVRNVGEGAVQGIVEGRRSGLYRSFGDYLTRAGTAGGNKKVVESLVKAGAFDSIGHARQGLFMVFEAACVQANKVNKKTAVGQDSLFGEESHEILVPDAEWDQSTRLDFEREMLGLYVSGHPLNGLEDILVHNRSVTLAEVLEVAEDEVKTKPARVTVCGMATTVERKTSHKGNAYAKLTLEDLDASLLVNVWGDAYKLASECLSRDGIYSIEGRVESNEGAVSLIAEKIRRLETVVGDQPVEIHFGIERATPEAVRELKGILREYPGTVAVRLHVRDGGKTRVCTLPDYLVNPTVEFASEVKSLLGGSCMQKIMTS